MDLYDLQCYLTIVSNFFSDHFLFNLVKELEFYILSIVETDFIKHEGNKAFLLIANITTMSTILIIDIIDSLCQTAGTCFPL